MTNRKDTKPWRAQIGGMWDIIGPLQFNYLVGQGLKPEHRLLDIGCGCLRGGVHFIKYLKPGNYYGIDRDHGILTAGLEKELPYEGLEEAELTLYCNSDFDFEYFGQQFDYLLAQSVFTHLPCEQILTCLKQANHVMGQSSQLFATFFEDNSYDRSADRLVHIPGFIKTNRDSDPFHYPFSAMQDLAYEAGLQVNYIGKWNHPRAQKMLCFRS